VTAPRRGRKLIATTITPDRFSKFAAAKTLEATRASIHPLETFDDRSARFSLRSIGNTWTRRLYGGDVHLFDPPADRPAVSLVFVQSLDGNTGAANPDDLGGGPTDKHLIYEGVSRVAADAVLAGATTAAGTNTFFSIWHPELVHLRQDLGLPRHPAQIVLSRHGRVDPDRTLLFNVPDVPVVVLVETGCHDRCRQQFADRPWVNVIPVNSDDVAAALGRLRKEHGIRRISAIGGRAAASSLLDAGLVQDLWLTTAPLAGGEPNTPFYTGRRPASFDLIVRKRETDATAPIVFEQLKVL
jgi:riboflavin biosynthesis pyrimidine reductase